MGKLIQRNWFQFSCSVLPRTFSRSSCKIHSTRLMAIYSHDMYSTELASIIALMYLGHKIPHSRLSTSSFSVASILSTKVISTMINSSLILNLSKAYKASSKKKKPHTFRKTFSLFFKSSEYFTLCKYIFETKYQSRILEIQGQMSWKFKSTKVKL